MIAACARRWPVLLALIAAAAPAAVAVPPAFDPDVPLSDLLITRYSVDDGLPTNSLYSVAQSSDGFLWASSFSGLVRFDGRRFSVIDRRTLRWLATDGFNSLGMDRDERLWVGTQGDGFLRYDQGRFEPLVAPPNERTAVSDLLVDRTGRTWIGTYDFGAFWLDGGQPVAVPHAPAQGVTIVDLLEDADGALWIATRSRGLTRVAGDRYTTFTTESGLANDWLAGLQSDGESLWIATRGGLNRLRAGALTEVPGTEADLSAILLDAHGNLWLGSTDGLIRRHGRSGKVERLSSFDGQTIGYVGGLTVDREGSLWFTTYSSGLFQLRASTFKNFTSEHGLGLNFPDTICERRPGEYWVGTYDGRVQVIRDDQISALRLRHAITHRVRHIYRDRDGGMWIAMDGSLLHVDGELETRYAEADGLPSDQIRLTFQDSRGQILVGTSAGMARLGADGRFRVFEELGSPFVMSIDEDAAGRLIVATRSHGLLIRQADGAVLTYGSEHGMPGTVVFETATDAQGDVWLATNGGLGRLRGGQIRRLTRQEGLPIDSVFDLVFDDSGHLWLSSAVGMIRLPKAALRAYLDGEEDGRVERVEAQVFDERDGMAERECVGARKILRDENGRLWVPTLGGVARLDPAHLPFNAVAPAVVLDAVRVDGRAIDLRQPGPLEIDPGPQRIELDFAAPSFVAPSKVRVRHMLEGFDTSWTEDDGERQVSYTNLGPGEYVFRIEAANNNGVWNRHAAARRLVIRPFFHQRPIFYVLAGAAGLLSVLALVRWRVAAVQRRNEQLQGLLDEQRRVERQREKLIQELETNNRELEQLSYSFSHDLKTPLVTIQGFIGWLQKDLDAGELESGREDLERIRVAAERMNLLLDGLRELLSLRRRHPERHHLPFGELAEQAVRRWRPQLDERGARVEIASDLPEVLGRRDTLMRALGHLLDNASRFVPGNRRPEIEIGARGDGASTVFFVRDNGIGIDPAYHERIFGLFTRLDAASDGIGIGLVLAQRAIESQGGRIWVESEGAGKGSTFCFTLPLPSGGPDPQQTDGGHP